MRDLIPPHELPQGMGPFSEGNFKLAVLSMLLENSSLDFGHFDGFLKFVEGPEYDYEKDGYAPSGKARDYLTRYPISDAMLDGLDTLYFDGGNQIYPYIHPFWGGETEEFDIQTLTDVTVLPALRTFGFSAMLVTTDLAPLAKCQALTSVELGLNAPWQNMAALLEVRHLTYLQAFKQDVNTKDAQSVLAALRDKGVAIDLF